MSRTNPHTQELRHPETGQTVIADFGSRSYAHFLSLGYSQPGGEQQASAEASKPAKKPRAKPVVKEADHGHDNP
ncbi:hypothetical protein DZC31_10215 [Stenotrophomonas rhizophila]|nr:hypothetical protein DZC31_10215 [Stenotrophomonas rhizophila]